MLKTGVQNFMARGGKFKGAVQSKFFFLTWKEMGCLECAAGVVEADMIAAFRWAHG